MRAREAVLSLCAAASVAYVPLLSPVPHRRHQRRAVSMSMLYTNGHSDPSEGRGVNGHLDGSYTYTNGAERQHLVNEALCSHGYASAAEEDDDASDDGGRREPAQGIPHQPQVAQVAASSNFEAATSSAASLILEQRDTTTDELKRQLILDAARELEKELSLAGAELAEARELRLSAAQLIEEGRLEAERHWRSAVDELEKRAGDLGEELAGLRRDQIRLQTDAARDRAALQESLDTLKDQLEAQQSIVSTERARAETLERTLSQVRESQELSVSELREERASFRAELAQRDDVIETQREEIEALKAQLTSSKTLARLLVKATVGSVAQNRKVLATRVRNRLVIFNKLAAICACGSVIALAPILGPKLALTLGSVV